jgi:hypothetical protein
MEWEASDFVDHDALANEERLADRRAFRHEMASDIPPSVFAFLILWHVLCPLVQAVWRGCQRRVRGWARGRRVSTPVNVDVPMTDVTLVDAAAADSVSVSIEGSGR